MKALNKKQNELYQAMKPWLKQEIKTRYMVDLRAYPGQLPPIRAIKNYLRSYNQQHRNETLKNGLPNQYFMDKSNKFIFQKKQL